MTTAQAQIMALLESHIRNLKTNNNQTTVEEEYFGDYAKVIKELERESGENLQRFSLDQKAIQTRVSGIQTFNDYGELTSHNPRVRFCAKTYFIGQLEALLAYLKSVAE
jgi:hypothetical protein